METIEISERALLLQAWEQIDAVRAQYRAVILAVLDMNNEEETDDDGNE